MVRVRELAVLTWESVSAKALLKSIFECRYEIGSSVSSSRQRYSIVPIHQSISRKKKSE